MVQKRLREIHSFDYLDGPESLRGGAWKPNILEASNFHSCIVEVVNF